jgi:glycerophosphoryl diester phosphodiesterase
MKKIIFQILILHFFSQMLFAELVCHWNFDGNLQDSCKSVCEPNVYGKINFADGISGKCLDLSGNGNNAVILNGSENLLNGLDSFTVCLWYKGNLKDNAPWAALVSKNGEDNQGWQLRFNNYEGGGCFTVRGVKGEDNCTGYAQIADNAWHHIAGVYDGKFICLYVDGVLEEVAQATGSCTPTESAIVIGAKIARGKNKPYAFAKGMLDDVRIYNQALAQNQIKELADSDTIIGQQFMADYARLGTYPIQLHRGGGVEQPENTLETFEWAWSKKVVPEADVRMTSDDEIVCFHDSDLKRTCPDLPDNIKEKGIGMMTLKEVKQFDVGKFRGKPGQKIPTLDEVFQAMANRPERFLYLDYKYIDMNRLAGMVKKYGIEKQVIFTNKSHYLIMQYKRLVPHAQAMLWTGGTESGIAKKLESLRAENFKGITILQMHYKVGNPQTALSDEFILNAQKELTRRGIILQLLPWKVDDEKVYEHLIDIGIQSFATDYPSATLKVYEKKIRRDRQ